MRRKNGQRELLTRRTDPNRRTSAERRKRARLAEALEAAYWQGAEDEANGEASELRAKYYAEATAGH